MTEEQAPDPKVRRTRGQITYENSGDDVLLDEPKHEVYKFLLSDGTSPYQLYPWPLPTKNPDGTWTPGEWVEEPSKLVTCQSGLHVAYIEDGVAKNAPWYYLPEFYPSGRGFAGQWEHERCFAVEIEGPVLYSQDQKKYVAGRVRLAREIEGWGEFLRGTRRSKDALTAEEQDQLLAKWLKRTLPPYLAALRKKGIPIPPGLARAKTIRAAKHAISEARMKVATQIELLKTKNRLDDLQNYYGYLRTNGRVKRQHAVRFRAPKELTTQLKWLEPEALSNPQLIAQVEAGGAPDVYRWYDMGRKRAARAKEIQSEMSADREAIIAARDPEPKPVTFDDLFPVR